LSQKGQGGGYDAADKTLHDPVRNFNPITIHRSTCLYDKILNSMILDHIKIGGHKKNGISFFTPFIIDKYNPIITHWQAVSF